MDTDDSGSIEIEELRKAYEHLNLLKLNKVLEFKSGVSMPNLFLDEE